MSEPRFERLYNDLVEEHSRLRAESAVENARLTHLLEELQKTLQASLEGNTELRKQLRDLQEKLDALLAKKRNRDRKDFDTKKEGRNPRPAPTSARKNQSPNEESEQAPDGLFEDPPDESIDHPLAEEERICPDCACETEFVGYKVTRQLEALLKSLKDIEHRQEVRSCPKCKTYIRTAARPPISPIPGSYAGPGLLAKVVVNKVEDCSPNYRQQKICAREGFPIPRSTQCDWMIVMSLMIEPLYELLMKQLFKSEVVQTDETGLKVQDRNHKGNMRKAKLIVCRGDEQQPYVSFTYSPTLKFEVNRKLFAGFKGIIQADAAKGFDALFRESTATEAGCNAHGRRKVFDARESEIEIVDKILDLYDAVYKIERRAKNLSPAQRLALRKRFCKPLMKKIRRMHVQNKKRFPPSHLLHEAAAYALRHWRALTLFLSKPNVAIDNNAAEREIKYLVMARKNFLFAGSDAGAKALAIHSTLVASARRNKLNPVAYLTDVFSRINDMKISELYKLLPDQWARFRPPTTIT